MAINNKKVIDNSAKIAVKLKDNRIVSALSKTAFDLLKQTRVPVVTHNLWDSIGCGIYKNGAMMKVVYPPKRAVAPRTEIYGTPSESRPYWGFIELQDMIMNPPASVLTHKGWCLYYVAAMPYAEVIDKRSDVVVLKDQLVRPFFESHIIGL